MNSNDKNDESSSKRHPHPPPRQHPEQKNGYKDGSMLVRVPWSVVSFVSLPLIGAIVLAGNVVLKQEQISAQMEAMDNQLIQLSSRSNELERKVDVLNERTQSLHRRLERVESRVWARYAIQFISRGTN